MNKIPKDFNALERKEIRDASFLEAKSRLKNYSPFAHKGTRGHAAIFAGSPGMMGAAILSTNACLRSGCGKTTTIIPETYFSMMHQSAPEALLSPRNPSLDLSTFSAIGVGPGIGTSTELGNSLKQVFNSSLPQVIDADALNYLSQNKDLLTTLPKDSILTPHLKEWERLFGKFKDENELINTLVNICNKYNFNILIKGYYSVLVTPSGEYHVNGTGNSGMGKAGSGDVLTGLLSGLLAQGYSGEDAGIIGMFVHGLSGDLAKEAIGEDAMVSGDLLQFLGEAFKILRDSNTID
jgi:NAD(P)H-hydrate epimerase